MVWTRTVLVCGLVGCLASSALAGPALLDDSFDGTKLDSSVWQNTPKDQSVYNVKDGTLRMVGREFYYNVELWTKQNSFNFFDKPIIVVWDLIPQRTLAGPFASTNDSKVYAGLTIGSADLKGTSAQLGLAGWPEGFPRPKDDAAWFYTLELGSLMPQSPTMDCRLTGMPRRIIWTIDSKTWSVEVKGETFVKGDSTKRSGQHNLKASDFSEYYLKMFTASHANSMEPGCKHISTAVYVDRITVVNSPKNIPAYTKAAPKYDLKSYDETLADILGPRPVKRTKPQYIFGVNYAGGNFRPQQGFVPPTEKSLDYYKSKGIMLMRMPIKWARLQPTLNGPLDPKVLGQIKKSVKLMADRKIKVIIDVHDYGTYKDGKIIGSKDVPLEAFQDFWKRLANEFKNESAIWGYDLMNEPVRMGDNWWKGAQAGIDGVREVDKKTMIIVSGSGWSGSREWMKDSYKLAEQIHDPSNNLCYQAHCYFDDGSGKYNRTYEYEINRPHGAIDPMVGVERIKPFVEWLKKTGNKGILGEFSVPANPDRDPRWLIVLDNVCKYMAKNEVPCTYWAGGDLWTQQRSYVIEPFKGEDRPQTQILLKHAATLK